MVDFHPAYREIDQVALAHQPRPRLADGAAAFAADTAPSAAKSSVSNSMSSYVGETRLPSRRIGPLFRTVPPGGKPNAARSRARLATVAGVEVAAIVPSF